MTSQNAADLLGIHQIGRIEVGAIAELLEYQKEGRITRVELEQ
jgi:N-acetylglucosamine-6-phosphate deacetylase